MKRMYFVLILAVALAALPVLAQHQHQRGPGHSQHGPQMMGEQKMMDGQMMPERMADLTRSWEKVRTAQTEQQRKASMEEHGRVLAQFQQHFQEHHQRMQEHMKSCPMIQREKEGEEKQHQH